MNEIISMLLHGGPDATVTNKMFTMLDAVPPERLDAMTSPRLLNTHAPYARFEQFLYKSVLNANNETVKRPYVL